MTTIHDPAAGDRPPANAPEPLLDLDRLLAAVRLRRRMCATLAALGLLLGLAFGLLKGKASGASARLVIASASDNSTDTEHAMETDVAYCHSQDVAAIAAADLRVDPQSLLQDYTCTAVTNSVLQIAVRKPLGGTAVRTTAALVDAYRNGQVARSEQTVAAQSATYSQQRSGLEKNLAQVLSSLAVAPDDQTADSLGDAQRSLMTQIDDLSKKEQDLSSQPSQVAASTSVIDPPNMARISSKRGVILPVVMGLVLGGGGGLALAVLAGVVRDRPTRRRDISVALHAPVLASMQFHRGRTGKAPTASAVLLHAAEGGQPVFLLHLDCAAAAEQLVTEATGRAQSPISCAALPLSDPAQWPDFASPESCVVLMLRPGRATQAELAAVVRDLALAQAPVLGIVLVDPDPKDHTDGLFDTGHRAPVRWPRAAASAPESP